MTATHCASLIRWTRSRSSSIRRPTSAALHSAHFTISNISLSLMPFSDPYSIYLVLFPVFSEVSGNDRFRVTWKQTLMIIDDWDILKIQLLLRRDCSQGQRWRVDWCSTYLRLWWLVWGGLFGGRFHDISNCLVVKRGEVYVSSGIEEIICERADYLIFVFYIFDLVIIESVPGSIVLRISCIVASLELTLMIRYTK